MTCPIGLAPIVVPRRLSCGHVFEEAKIAWWLDISNTCPMCRAVPFDLHEFNKTYEADKTDVRAGKPVKLRKISDEWFAACRLYLHDGADAPGPVKLGEGPIVGPRGFKYLIEKFGG